MSEPVTVIITCFNLHRYIRDAVDSALAQDYDGLVQIVVVDDCSTDTSPDILGSYEGIEVVRLERNGGVMNATLEGLKRAHHDAIFFLDGDDIWNHSKLSHCMALLDEEVAFITHDLNYIDRDRRSINLPTKVSLILGDTSVHEHDALIRHCITHHMDYVWLGSAYGIRRSLIRIEEFFAYCRSKTTLRTVYQDWPIAAWVAIAASGEMRYVDQALFDYRIHGENYSGDSGTREKFIRNLSKSLDTMMFIEEMSFYLDFGRQILPAYSRARARYTLQLACVQNDRIKLISKSITNLKAFGLDRDGLKLVARVGLGIIVGPERAYHLIEVAKAIGARR